MAGTVSNGHSKKVSVAEHPLTDAQLFEVLYRVRNGDFSVRLPAGQTGLKRSICETMNEIIDLNARLAIELARSGKAIGKQGKLNQRIRLDGARGCWNDCVDTINELISDLAHPTLEVAHVITSVAQGNLTEEMPLEIEGVQLKGEFLRVAKEVNSMVTHAR